MSGDGFKYQPRAKVPPALSNQRGMRKADLGMTRKDGRLCERKASPESDSGEAHEFEGSVRSDVQAYSEAGREGR